jgi:hypothetical protein
MKEAELSVGKVVYLNSSQVPLIVSDWEHEDLDDENQRINVKCCVLHLNSASILMFDEMTFDLRMLSDRRPRSVLVTVCGELLALALARFLKETR